MFAVAVWQPWNLSNITYQNTKVELKIKEARSLISALQNKYNIEDIERKSRIPLLIYLFGWM